MRPAAPILLFLIICVPPARAGSHSLRYFFSALSEELHEVPQYTLVGYVNDEEITFYSSVSRRLEPRAPWMERVAESHPQYWEKQMEVHKEWEMMASTIAKTVMGHHNQSAGLHTFQVTGVCELHDDGSTGGFFQLAYDGQDFLSFDKENMKFIEAMDAATITTRHWSKEENIAQRIKAYLDRDCIEWLQKYLNYGKERLLRRVPPQVRISRRKSDSATTLTCYAYGFYPREIEMKWMRNDREVDWKTKTVLPNTDGDYQIRTTLELPEEHEKDYRCLVDHIGLEDLITKVYKEESGTWYMLIIVGAIVGVIILAVITAVVLRKRKHPVSLLQIQ